MSVGGSMKAIFGSRLFLWLLLALPGAGMLYALLASPDDYTPSMAIGHTGDWAAWLLMFTLAVTPLRLLFRGRKWTAWLLRRRREFGLASFGYALAHTVIYVIEKETLDNILFEFSFPDVWVGWLALALFIPLALTSNNISTRALGRWWKRMHWLVYPAAIATFAHWVLASFDPTVAWAHIAVMAAIVLLRIVLEVRLRTKA